MRSQPTKHHVSSIPRDDQETVIVATPRDVIVSTSNPAAWRALKRRLPKLGGRVLWADVNRKDAEVGGCITFPPTAFTLARFGLRAKAKQQEAP